MVYVGKDLKSWVKHWNKLPREVVMAPSCQSSRIKESTTFQLAGTYNDDLVHLPEQFRADSKVNYVVKGIV